MLETFISAFLGFVIPFTCGIVVEKIRRREKKEPTFEEWDKNFWKEWDKS